MTDVLSAHNQWSRSVMPNLVSKSTNHRKTLHRMIFYRNGDRYFTGKQIHIIPQNYLSFKQFLHDLSSAIDLPYGIRRLFAAQNGSEITDLNCLKDGGSYVCASFEPFQKLEYSLFNAARVTFNHEMFRQPLHDLPSTHRINMRHLPSISLPKLGAMNNAHTTNRFQANHLFLQSLTSSTANAVQQKKNNLKYNKYGIESSYNKPRTITIVKQGSEKPHKMITILLNRRTAQTYDQLISDISESFGYQKNRTERIKRIFTLKGRQVNAISDFFREDEIFIASTNATDIPWTDLQEITNELFNDPHHATSRRNQLKSIPQMPSETENPTPPMLSTGQISIDVKKAISIRDSGFLDEEDGVSGRDGEHLSSRGAPNKVTEPISEDTSTPAAADVINRKLKKTNKPITTMNIEQQRERERQRLREDEERRKRFANKKEYPQSMSTTSVPKFEQLIIDNTHEEKSTSNKALPSVLNKLPINVASEDSSSKKASSLKRRSSIIYPSPAIVTDRYEFGRKMGDGNFAIVRRSKLRESDREVAIKIIDKSKMKNKEYMLDHEINIMYMCHHPNIIRLFEDYETPDEIYLIMELIKGGDLFDYITKHRRFDESTSSLMVKDIAEALLYLHAKKIVHRDLKPENLLVMQRKDGRITIKLTDFGLAMQVTGPIKTVCGTPTYVAPEILAETGYGIEVDCWATGIILYILLCGYPPFKTADRNQEELFQLIQRGKFSYETEHWNTISAAAKNLIDQLLVVDRFKRIRAEDILVHSWILTVGQSKTIRQTEESKMTLRNNYETKIKEYAMENLTPC